MGTESFVRKSRRIGRREGEEKKPLSPFFGSGLNKEGGC